MSNPHAPAHGPGDAGPGVDHGHGSAGSHGHDEPHEHISPLSMYFQVFGTLVILTILTVAVSYMGFGKAAIFVAMAVALAKAFMVCAYFMHLKWEDPFNRFVLLASLGFMSIFFIITATDVGYRGQINPETDTMVLRDEDKNRVAEEKRREQADKKLIEFVRPPGTVPNGSEASPLTLVTPMAAPPAPAAPAHH